MKFVALAVNMSIYLNLSSPISYIAKSILLLEKIIRVYDFIKYTHESWKF